LNVREIIGVYRENHMRHTDEMCGYNAETASVVAGVLYNNCRVLKARVYCSKNFTFYKGSRKH
jgi:hypothetical protein